MHCLSTGEFNDKQTHSIKHIDNINSIMLSQQNSHPTFKQNRNYPKTPCSLPLRGSGGLTNPSSSSLCSGLCPCLPAHSAPVLHLLRCGHVVGVSYAALLEEALAGPGRGSGTVIAVNEGRGAIKVPACAAVVVAELVLEVRGM
jgi:hypothetical protein